MDGAGERTMDQTTLTMTPTAPQARALARSFLTPARATLDAAEREVLAAARRFDLPFAPGRRVAAYEWGARGPRVLLVHGWSSAAGQLAAFVPPLVERGFRALSFDAPAHGASEGTWTSAAGMAQVVLAAGARLGPFHAVVAHSAGATAAVLAATRGLCAGRLALLSPWARPARWIGRYAAALGLSTDETARLAAAVEDEAGATLASLELAAMAPAVARPILVVHDRDDALVDLGDVRAAAAALTDGTLVETSGFGHSRVLRASEVVEAVVAFVSR